MAVALGLVGCGRAGQGEADARLLGRLRPGSDTPETDSRYGNVTTLTARGPKGSSGFGFFEIYLLAAPSVPGYNGEPRRAFQGTATGTSASGQRPAGAAAVQVAGRPARQQTLDGKKVVPPGEVSQRVVPTKVTFTVFDRGSLLYDVSLSGEAADHERYRPVYDQGWQPSRFPNEIGSLDAVVGN